nr:torn and diminished rhabdomeres, isoform C [Drosophila melanogaster]AAF53954.2 torn and diminished rhabdomeres, isoform C [Drosophila melanogaster]|eukprot:NP_610082.2 torn and diminished rhabdomeres, isoform C [Drosophila melanogaster]
MSSGSLLDVLCSGSGARLALGASVISYLIVYNEASAPSLLVGVVLATVYGAMAARCKTSLRSLQMPYVRATNKFDFSCLFLAIWLDALATVCACAALARTLSACLDAMTGGLARILILGRNAPANEPWPDVLGVSVVFLVTGMFMLGLEHSRAFSLILTLGMFGLNAILSAVGWWRGDMLAWSADSYFQPDGISSVFLGTALLTYSFPGDWPQQLRGGRFTATLITGLVSTSLLLTAICLSTVVHYRSQEDYVAVPLFNILDENGFHKLVPASACMLLLTSSAAFLELFPELYGIVVRLATSEWRILSKQISYESSESGNPVLAVFIAGSMCAMLAFACPLQHLSYTLAAGHMGGVFLRALYLLYIPYRPKYMAPSSESSLSYSRLSTAPFAKSSSYSSAATSSSSRLKRSLWKIGLPKHSNLKKPKTKPRNKQELEKEWLLLGEPTSPCPQREGRDVESTILSDGEPPPSDFEYPDKFDKSDSDTSTDIDAIVDEYREKIKVTTAGPLERSVRVPTVSSWRVTIFAIVVIGLGIALCIAGLMMHWAPAALTGGIGVLIVTIMMGFIPKYTGSVINVSPVICGMSLLMGVILFSGCAIHSWPGLLIWLMAGLILVIRCDKYCCNCFEHTTIMNAQLIPSVSGKSNMGSASGSASNLAGPSTSIRIPRPPKGMGVVGLPQRINEHR